MNDIKITEDGYVERWYFEGPMARIKDIAHILGLNTDWAKPHQRKGRLVITRHDKITPEKLAIVNAYLRG